MTMRMMRKLLWPMNHLNITPKIKISVNQSIRKLPLTETNFVMKKFKCVTAIFYTNILLFV